MKKTLTFAFIIAAAVGVTACGKKGDVNPPKPQTNSVSVN